MKVLEEKKKKKKMKQNQRLKVYYVPHFKCCSFISQKKKKKKNKNKKNNELCDSSVPIKKNTMIIRKKTTITSTIITPFIDEEEKNNKVKKKKKKFIYFCVKNNVFNGPLKWFKLNPNNNTRGTVPTLSPICLIPCSDSFPKGFSVVGFDSKLYVVGGYFSQEKNNFVPTSKTFVFDTSHDSNWNECCSMNSPRISPSLTVVDGQIYAIGSSSKLLNSQTCSNPYPWAEVFDPSLDEWTPLPSPPTAQYAPDVHNSLFRQDLNEIVILPGNKSNCFNVKNRSWTCIRNPLRKACSSKATCVAIGDIVFSFARGQLYACDLSKPKPKEEPVYGLEKETESIPPDSDAFIGHLFYIGNGRLCLMWDMVSSEADGMLVITCVKFWVGKRNGKGQLCALIDRTDCYWAEGADITSCLAM